MALPNLVLVLLLPFAVLAALPFAIFAAFTSILAFFVLWLQLIWANFAVLLETLRYVFLGHGRPRHFVPSPSESRRSSRPTSPTMSPPLSPEALSPKSYRPRRRTASIGSNGAIASGHYGGQLLTTSSALDRDYEGLGGWRLQDGRNAADEKAWESLNSRFEVPDHHRHHYRSQTHSGAPAGACRVGSSNASGARSNPHSPERVTLAIGSNSHSPRSRTPSRAKVEPFTNVDQGSYFPPFTSTQPRKIAT
ncbi:hypothetical protein JX265_000252 [Neoarthrinium moseri]|uniref:Uncharacterized protein n=1 Tax=Neoarthrinium moseri TaxID=1658444 RepID=A0A9P9WY71_9PEZI|nr:hypothetical protein JX266_001955 [Neoarthrinium moseri]KAI1881426.1 hypothetical protein JX265_000252 [Neoarthrinium moseri]